MQKERLFAELNLSSPLLTNLGNAGFEHASPIQDMTIGPILEGKDIFALAETGSGKTGSFVIPMVEMFLGAPEEFGPGSFVILSPTRELAQQTKKVVDQMGAGTDLKSVTIIGGEDIEKQKDKVQSGAQIMVCTPGRLVDLKKQKVVDLSKVKVIVFDEADRLFDMGFASEIESILQGCPKNRQIIMVSATGNMEVLKTAYKYHSQPVEIKLNVDELVVDSIDHWLAMLSTEEKMPLLVNTLSKNPDAYALVFCNTQYQTHLVAEWLKSMNFKAKPISGRLAQNKRTRLMEEFRNKDVTILVCTDVAARGLDIKDVNLVINYDMPSEAANYVHRIGRTGRAGASGKALSFCAHDDCENLEAIYKLLDAKIPKMELSNEDFEAKLAPKPRIDGKTLRLRSEERDNARSDRKGDRKKGPKDSKKKGPRTQQPPLKMEPVQMPAFPNFAKSEANPNDTRVYQITSEDLQSSVTMAQGYFRVRDRGLIDSEVLVKGRKKFFIFGPRKNTYKMTVKPIYKKLLTPLLTDIFKLAYLDITPEVSYKSNSVRVYLQGQDLELVADKKHEFCHGIENYIKAFLAKKLFVPRNLKVSVLFSKFNDSTKERPARGERPSRGDRPSRGRDGRRNGNKRPIDEKKIQSMAQKLIDQVKESQGPVQTKPLNPAERRIVHQFVSDSSDFATSSIGDGRLKKIEIAPQA